jgi:hypothetical protein
MANPHANDNVPVRGAVRVRAAPAGSLPMPFRVRGRRFMLGGNDPDGAGKKFPHESGTTPMTRERPGYSVKARRDSVRIDDAMESGALAASSQLAMACRRRRGWSGTRPPSGGRRTAREKNDANARANVERIAT